MNRLAFPHLENLDRVPEILDVPQVTITEKIHGFNARFGRDENGTSWIGSRNNTFDADQPPPLQGFSDFARSRLAIVSAGYTVYGEWCGKGIQGGIDYGEPHFRLFAIRHLSEPTRADVTTLRNWAFALQCKHVPLLYEGSMPSLVELDLLRQAKSSIAEQGREGIVITPITPLLDAHGHPIIAKYKAPNFSERAHDRKPRVFVFDMSTAEDFAIEYVTSGRLSHVLDQIGETIPSERTDLNPLSRQLTGDVLRAMYQDVIREAGDEYEKLSDNDKKHLGKVINRLTLPILEAARMKDAAASSIGP